MADVGWRVALLLAAAIALQSARAQDWTLSPLENISGLDRMGVSQPAENRKSETVDASAGLNAASSQLGRTANFGPLGLSLGAVGSLEYNDNVRVEPHARSGLIASAGLQFDSTYQVTQLQQLSLRGSISNRMPLYGPGKRERLMSVSPDSALRFNVWVKSIRVSSFLKYRRQLDPVLSPVVSRTAILDQEVFTPGLQVDLPMHESGLQLLFSREFRSQRGDTALAQRSWSNWAASRYTMRVGPTQNLSIDAAAVGSKLKNASAAEARALIAGVSADWKLSPTKSIRARGGFSRNTYEGSKNLQDHARGTTPYFGAEFDQALRGNFSYAVKFDHSKQEGVTSNYFRLTEVGLTPQWRMSSRVALDSSVAWQWLHESGVVAERATRSVARLGLSRVLGATLSMRLIYEQMLKHSDFGERNYSQHRFTTSGSYQF